MPRVLTSALVMAMIALPAMAGSFSSMMADGRSFGMPEPAAIAVLAIGLTTALRKRIR
ncbi:MAG TPA: hypothetical protein PLX06_04515 [Fimbriimonadaceae bacterium]|nr:hypothetical protein [Fimbriimonadaceae bacterium]